MTVNELDAETVTYHGKVYRVWNLNINGEDVEIGEIELEREILDEDGTPIDEKGFHLDEKFGYYADPTEEVEDVIRGYLD